MPPAASFTNHLFISYAHIDNEHFPGTEKGWIDLLDASLELRLRQLMGAPVKIWRDRSELKGNDVFNEKIADELCRSAILLSIVSPRYLKSPSCQGEFTDFCRCAAENRGLRIGRKLRIFRAVKTFVPDKDYPPSMREIRETLGYEFYAEDEETKRFYEYEHEIGPKGEKDRRYWDKLEDLAQDITTLLKQMFDENDVADLPLTAGNGDCIYLAETTSDLTDERDKIKRELQQYGHTILPDRALPLSMAALQDAVRDYLMRSRLSVHLIGEHYGIIPEMESERSIVRVQQDLAVERGDNAQFSRLIWMPPGLHPRDERQLRYVEALQNGFSSQNGSELLQVKLEDLKTIIQTKLTQKPKPPAPPAGDDVESPRVYLICDQEDVDEVEPLRNHLFERGCEVTLPLLEGSQADVLKDHQENLLLCHAVLIFQGRAGENWLRMKLRELLKLKGYGRTAPLRGKVVYIGAPQSPAKERFKTLEAQLIKDYGKFNPVCLEPFIAQISKAKGQSA